MNMSQKYKCKDNMWEIDFQDSSQNTIEQYSSK